MSQKDELTSEQKKELTKIAAEIEAEAIQMKIDYDINPSEESGSVVYIHQESSLLENEDEKLDDVALVSSSKLLAKELKEQKKKNGDKK
jgi:predicted ribosome-associated RNA-binding protein Tma20|tara:strand:+ start:1345 stop:1611 length:267 start_codon:yes stop_codon:yes gene_type:complete